MEAERSYQSTNWQLGWKSPSPNPSCTHTQKQMWGSDDVIHLKTEQKKVSKQPRVLLCLLLLHCLDQTLQQLIKCGFFCFPSLYILHCRDGNGLLGGEKRLIVRYEMRQKGVGGRVRLEMRPFNFLLLIRIITMTRKGRRRWSASHPSPAASRSALLSYSACRGIILLM